MIDRENDRRAASTVLVADGRPAALGAVAETLASDGHRVLVSEDAGTALDVLACERPAMALLHHDILADDGGLLFTLRSLSPGLPILVYGCRPGPSPAAAPGVGAVGVDGDDPRRLRELVMSALLASCHVDRLRDEYERRSRQLGRLCQTLRAPLHVVQGYAELLRDMPTTPGTHAALAGLAGAVAQALRLTAEHVALADADQPGSDAPHQPVELDGLLSELRNAVARADAGHPVRLLARAPFPGAVIHVDGQQLGVLLAHLALRCGAPRTPSTVRLRVRGTAAGTRFELTASRARGAAAAAALDQAGDPGWAVAQRLGAQLGASLARRGTPATGTVIVLDLPTHLGRAALPNGRPAVH